MLKKLSRWLTTGPPRHRSPLVAFGGWMGLLLSMLFGALLKCCGCCCSCSFLGKLRCRTRGKATSISLRGTQEHHRSPGARAEGRAPLSLRASFSFATPPRRDNYYNSITTLAPAPHAGSALDLGRGASGTSATTHRTDTGIH